MGDVRVGPAHRRDFKARGPSNPTGLLGLFFSAGDSPRLVAQLPLGMFNAIATSERVRSSGW